MCLLFITRPKNILHFVTLINALVAAINATISKSLPVVLFFSRLLHARWMMATPMCAAIVYFIFYCCITAPVFLVKNNLRLRLLILNLAGLPPLSGFIIKLRVLRYLSVILGVLLLLHSLTFLYSYLRVFLMESPPNGDVNTITIMACMIGLAII